jgi:hypothetical protein
MTAPRRAKGRNHMTLQALVQEKPADHADTRPLESREITVEGASYDECRAAVDAQLPEGWRVLWVRTVAA